MMKIARSIPLVCALLCVLIVSGCSTLSKEEAEHIALMFVNERVKFYSTDANTTQSVRRYNTEIIDSHPEGKNWEIIILVTSPMRNETKKAKMRVVVDQNKRIVRFDPHID